MPGRNIECEVIKVLKENKSLGGSNQLRVVRWLVDGKDTGTVLEKRNFYVTKEGETKTGKARGFTKDDLTYIVDSWKEIQALM